MSNILVLSKEEAKHFLLGHLGLKSCVHPKGTEGAKAMIKNLRCVQIDTLDKIGTNQDLVSFARVDGMKRGDIFKLLSDGHHFEHWFKERCIMPAQSFPYYYHRDDTTDTRVGSETKQTESKSEETEVPEEQEEGAEDEGETTKSKPKKSYIETSWFRTERRKSQISESELESVLKYVAENGPVRANEMPDIGKVTPIDWDGWKGTSKKSNAALDVLWTQCNIVAFRTGAREKYYHLPESFFAEDVVKNLKQKGDSTKTDTDFETWAMIERVESMGLCSSNNGPHWSTIRELRNSDKLEKMVEQGLIQKVQIKGASKIYYAPTDLQKRTFPDFDDRYRIIAPLDPIIWERDLVKKLWNFDYVWEVYPNANTVVLLMIIRYKPVAERKWGYYVCPLLYKGEFVGRIEGQVQDGKLIIMSIFREKIHIENWNEKAFIQAVERHAECCDAKSVVFPDPMYKDDEPETPQKKKRSTPDKKNKTQKAKKQTKKQKKSKKEESDSDYE